METVNKAKAQILAQAYPSIICDTFNCNTRAKYSIAINGGPPNKRHNLCEACARNVVLSGLELGLVTFDASAELGKASVQIENLLSDNDALIAENQELRDRLDRLMAKAKELAGVETVEPEPEVEEEIEFLTMAEIRRRIANGEQFIITKDGQTVGGEDIKPLEFPPHDCGAAGGEEEAKKEPVSKPADEEPQDSLDTPGEGNEEVSGDEDSGQETIDLYSLSYQELQELAKERGLKYIGVSKDDLIDSLKEATKDNEQESTANSTE